MQIIDESSYLYYDEIKNKMYLEEYQFINGEDLYNLETIAVVNGRLERIKEEQEKLSKRKQEVYSMLKLSNENLLKEYANNKNFYESRFLEKEILKRMN